MNTNDNSTLNGNALETALAAGKALGTPINVPGFRPVIVFPENYKASLLEHAEDKPLPGFVTQAVGLSDADSFIDYVTKYKQANTLVFFTTPGLATLLAMKGTAQFLAVLDYHIPENGEAVPDRCSHRARFDCPFSIEWTAWITVNNQPLSQEKFIDFIEANSRDVSSPSAADLMEMAINFEASSSGKFANKINRTVTGKQLTYTEQTDASSQVAGQKVTVPETLTLLLPVFEGGEKYPLTARLIYTVKEGRLTITIALLRPHLIIREALDAVRESIATELKLEVLSGGLL